MAVSLHIHDMLRHLLRRMRWPRWRLELRMRAHGRAHMRHLLVLDLLRAACMHHFTSFAQLL
jgi:hypothetical protein